MSTPLVSRKYGLKFFSDEILDREVQGIYDAALKAKSDFNIHKNVLDPFMATFTSRFESLSRDEWIARESVRQFDKAIEVRLGAFHQAMLGHLSGWENQGSGGYWDLKSTKKFGVRDTLVIAEVKNKHNTMNSESKKKLFQRFSNALELPEYKSYTAYLVEVIPKSPFDGDRKWSPMKDGSVERIRRITAKDVYAQSTGSSGFRV